MLTQTFLPISTPQPPPVLAGGACPECGQATVCSVCGRCHYCCDIDLPCGAASVRRRINEIMSAIALRAHCVAAGQWNVMPSDQGRITAKRHQRTKGWQIIRPKGRGPRWPEGGAGCPASSPSLPRCPRSGAVAQPQAQEQQREVALCL